MKDKNYDPRICVICGIAYKPTRSDQRTCGSAECKKARQRLNYLEYRKKNYAAILAGNRHYAAKKREEKRQAAHPTKPDTIVAIGYADRQREQTLQMVGKVKVTL